MQVSLFETANKFVGTNEKVNANKDARQTLNVDLLPVLRSTIKMKEYSDLTRFTDRIIILENITFIGIVNPKRVKFL